ncbi:MAG: dienelactone hydrolase family protein [Alphaproteobacteria bacterium]
MLAASLLVGACAAPAVDAKDELERTWRAARVHLPGASGPAPRIEALGGPPPGLAPGARLPTVIYLHGCSGIDVLSEREGGLLAGAGYAVIMPDSFARRHKPKSCDVVSRTGGAHRGVLGWRQDEALNAIERARALPWVDAGNLFLMGFSEGAVTAATLGATGTNARIVEGWTCHAGWPEYVGLNAPEGEPVLALVGANDPWFRLPVLRGDCGAYMERGNGSRSIVFEAPHPLADEHFLSWHDEAGGAIIDFLDRHRAQPSEAPP